MQAAAWSIDGSASIASYKGRSVLQVESGFGFKRDVRLLDGTIDFDVELTRRRSFVYLQFRMLSDDEHEEVYLRPHKSDLPDALQYAPVWQGQSAWQLHHGPGGTGAALFDAGVWTHVRLILQGRNAALFVNDMTTPVLLVPRLMRDPKPGYIALGGFANPENGNPVARFSNIVVQPDTVNFNFAPALARQAALPAPALPAGIQPTTAPPTAKSLTIREWSVSKAFAAGTLADVPVIPSRDTLGAFQPLATEPDGLLELHRHVQLPPSGRYAAALARTGVRAERAGTYALDLGFSDVATVFVNGAPVFTRDDSYSFDQPRREGLIGYDQARIYVPLRAGANEISILVSDRFGGWGLMGRFADRTGLTLTPVDSAQVPAPALWAGLTAGVHDVGFRQLPGTPASYAWYPASPGGSPMTLRAYFGKGADELSQFLKSAKLPDAAAARYLDAPLAAHRDAPAAAGAFPIVALAQGNAQTAGDQAVLGEFIASHGFIVVTTDSPMIATPMSSEAEVGPMAEQQAVELGHAVDAVSAWPSAKRDARFAVGHSFGARAALLMAMRDPSIRGVVSLDGGIGTATASDVFRKAPSYDASRARAPILHFYEDLDAFMKPDFTLLQSLPAPLTRTPLAGMHHAHFTTVGFGAAIIPELAALTSAGPQIGESLRRMGSDILAFLQK
jgi:dienelactone hydrolase